MLPAPVLSTGVANANGSVTLTGTATAGVTVTVWNGGSSALGTTKASSTGAWTFTTSGLKAGAYTFTATDPTATAASPASSPLSLTVPLPAAPVIGKEVENSNDTVTVTGTAVASSTVNLSCNGGAIGTASVNSAGAWSFTTGLLNPAPYGFTATDTTSAGTSAASAAVGLTVVVAAPVISGYTANANGSITLTGNAANGSTVTVSDGGSKPLGTATASSAGAWSFTTSGLPAATYKFTATDTISSGTSGTSNAYYVKNPLPAAPAITTSQVNSDDSITMAGTGVAGSTLTVWSTSGTKIGTTTVSSSGTWNEGIGAQSAGVYGYEATDTTAAGTSGDSNVISLTIPSASVALASAISSAAASSSTSVASTTTANSNALALVSASALHAAAA